MMGLDLAALGEERVGVQLYLEWPPRDIYSAKEKNLPQNVK